MASTPYPLPRQTRESSILTGNSTAGPYGPTTFKVFDVEDIEVIAKAEGEAVFTPVDANDYSVAKTSALPFDTISVTFDATVPATTSFVIRAARVAERSVAVTRGGAIDSDQLEKELSKIATTQSEARRDLDRAVQTDPGVPPIRIAPGASGSLAKFDAAGNVVDAGIGAEAIEAVNDNMAAILAAPQAAADAEAAAAAAEADRVQTGLDRTQTGLDTAAVAADKATVEGYRSDTQGYMSTASMAADTAVTAQVAAEAARDAVLSTYDQFDDRYLGTFSVDPVEDNDGNPLQPGALYFFDGDGVPETAEMRIWRGDMWVAAYVSGTGFLAAASNLADLPNKPAARANLDVYSTAEVQALPDGRTAQTTLADADYLQTIEGGIWKKISWANVKTALNSLYQAASAKLSALSALTWANNTMPYFTGTGTVASTALTAAARNLLDDGDAATMRGTLGIGSMATRNVTISTAAPSGGADGDIWLQYTP